MKKIDIDVATTALLIMDCQNEIIHPEGKMGPWGFAAHAEARGIVPRITALASAARGVGAPVIYITVAYDAGHREVRENARMFRGARKNQTLLKGTWSVEVLAGLTPQPEDLVINKLRVNAFYGSSLEVTLTGLNTSTLILCGVATNFVVESTARHAADAGYRVVVAEDCCASMNDEMHAFSAQHILPIFADVTSSDALIASLKA